MPLKHLEPPLLTAIDENPLLPQRLLAVAKLI